MKKNYKLFLIPMIVVGVLISILFAKNITVQKSMSVVESPGCGPGQYFNGTSCANCPSPYTSIDNQLSISINDCYVQVAQGQSVSSKGVSNCSLGTSQPNAQKVHYPNTLSCTPCPKGTYGSNGISCTSCPTGKTTESTGAIYESECVNKTYACYICGNSQGAKHVWATSDVAGMCALVPNVTSQAACNALDTPTPSTQSCYKCGSQYYWGSSMPTSDCSSVPSASTKAACEALNNPVQSCYKCGSQYYWGSSMPTSDCSSVPSASTKAACEALNNPVQSCYKCGSQYYWGSSMPTSDCSSVPSASTKAACEALNNPVQSCYKCGSTFKWTTSELASQCAPVSYLDSKSACEAANNPSPNPGSGDVSVTGISVKPTKWLLGIGEQKTIYPTITPSDATNKSVSYSSSDTSVVNIEKIGQNGMTTGVEVGNVTITAKTVDGEKTATAEISVVGSETTKQIMNTRINESLTRLIDATEDYIYKDQTIEKDSSNALVYPFSLGCDINEHYCFDSVEYGNQITSTTENDTTITIDEIKDAWNKDINAPNRWDNNGMNDGVATIADDTIKDSYYAIYKNVGKYGDKNIDVKVTIVDFEPMQDERYLISKPAILITNKDMGVAVTGIKWVKVKYEFLNSDDNSEKVDIRGNTTYWDIDLNQGVLINDDNTNKGIFFTNNGLKYNDFDTLSTDNVDNQLYYRNISDGIYIFDHNSGIDQSVSNPLYADDLNSTAYAFAEQFEGSEIIRTFQYSNPVFKNSANERVWNGHGAIYVSSTLFLAENQHAIITEVENGEISLSTSVYDGGNVTIKYSPYPKYKLSYIEIDDVKQNLKGITTEYTFRNVTEDHYIKVVYASGGIVPSPTTGIFEVGGILFIVLAIGGVSYFLMQKKKISNI